MGAVEHSSHGMSLVSPDSESSSAEGLFCRGAAQLAMGLMLLSAELVDRYGQLPLSPGPLAHCITYNRKIIYIFPSSES